MLNAMEENKLQAAPGWGGNGYAGGAYLTADGQFGSQTKHQVIVFQRWQGNISVNGRVGQQTWAFLCDYAWHNNLTGPWANAANTAGSNAGCHH